MYAHPDLRVSEHISLAQATLRVPRGVICLHSALRFHEQLAKAPHQVWLAIPQNSPTPRVESPLRRPVRMSGHALTEGVQFVRIDGVDVPIFNLAKTIVDCFKYRNKIGIDVAMKALRMGWDQRKVAMES